MIPDLIYDIGMHDGSDAAYYLAKGFRVIAVEANPDLCSAASERFADEIRAGRLEVLNVGITAEPGEFEFYVCPHKLDWSSFEQTFANRSEGVQVVRVKGVTMASLLNEKGVPYYLKIDIEGHDRLALSALIGRSDLPRYVSVEATVGDFREMLEPLGYGGFKLVNQVHIGSVPPSKPALEGRSTEMAIVPGRHSGQFGDESYGPWLSPHEFTEEYNRLLTGRYEGSLHQQIGVPQDVWGQWYDFHAKLGTTAR